MITHKKQKLLQKYHSMRTFNKYSDNDYLSENTNDIRLLSLAIIGCI
jgi:hypothetical protein